MPDIQQRERQRLRANVNDYNWSCSISRQEYTGSNCDGKELINQHMKCGSTFQNLVGSINVYTELQKACRAVREYKSCVRPIFQNDDCQSNQDLMDRLLRFSHTVLKEYSSACKDSRETGYQDAPGEKDDETEVATGLCRFEQLRQRTLQCQKEAYSIIRTREAHSKVDICEELKVSRDCAFAALKGTHCAKDKNARQFVAGIVRESFAKFGIECNQHWNTATSTTVDELVRVLLALCLSVALLHRA